MIVAIAALMIAVGGTAIGADPPGQLTASKVKKIANGEMTKRAPRLKVAKAENATRATNADNAAHAISADNAAQATNAVNATHAATASDSARLNGEPASAYLGRVAFTSRTAGVDPSVDLPGDDLIVEVLPPVSITVPGGQRFVRVGFSALVATNGSYSLWFQQDGPCAYTGPGFDQRISDNSHEQVYETVTSSLVLPVDPGAHTYRLCGGSYRPGIVITRSLSVETIPRDATGE